MDYKDILRFGEIQYLMGRLDELYKGYVPISSTRDNRIVDSRISKYEDKLKSIDEVAFYLYVTEKRNKLFSKNRGKKEMKELLLKCLEHVTDETVISEIKTQIEKY